jgi:hypothetical protein|tara:strand:- start:2050 stop:2412 length:363 start_codon:yes stop_codon:yes gene_type:complete
MKDTKLIIAVIASVLILWQINRRFGILFRHKDDMKILTEGKPSEGKESMILNIATLMNETKEQEIRINQLSNKMMNDNEMKSYILNIVGSKVWKSVTAIGTVVAGVYWSIFNLLIPMLGK